jgi:hypothetical protein
MYYRIVITCCLAPQRSRTFGRGAADAAEVKRKEIGFITYKVRGGGSEWERVVSALVADREVHESCTSAP